MKLKSTALILGAVLLIFTGVLGACGSRVYQQLTAPRVAPAAAPDPRLTPALLATASPPPPVAGSAPATPAAAEQAAVRAAFAALLPRARVLSADAATLRAYDRAAQTAAAQAQLAPDYAWPPLHSDFVFVYTALGPENPLSCAAPDACRLTQAVLGIQAVLLLDPALCVPDSAPCLTPLADHQVDARDNLITADFQRDLDGAWRLCGWEITPLPAPPPGW